jgi:protoporphyrinogen oxidase
VTSADVAIVGAGPSGLMAAWRAASAGHHVVVLDGAPVVGGMAGSFEVDGVRVDYGSHRLHPSIDPTILDGLRLLLGDDLQVRPRRGRVRLADRWVAFPLQLSDLVRHLPPSFAARAAAGAAMTPMLRARDDTTAEVLRASLGPAVAEEFYEPYLTKLWGLSPHELSGELARRRVSARSPLDLVRRALRTPADAGRTFLYPRHGYGQIADALADAAVAAGADIHLGERVERIALGRDAVQLSTERGVVEAARVWSTAPISRVLPMVDPAPPADVLAAATGLEHRALVLVYLAMARPAYTAFDAHYFPSLANPVSRLSEPKRYRDGEDPPDRTVVCAEVPCSVDDPIWRSSDTELQSMVERALAREGLPRLDTTAVVTRRLPRVYPIYRVGFERAMQRLDRWVSTQDRLLVFGRQGLFVQDNTHHVLAMGWAAADALGADGHFDDQRWLRARDRFAGHVVED